MFDDALADFMAARRSYRKAARALADIEDQPFSVDRLYNAEWMEANAQAFAADEVMRTRFKRLVQMAIGG